MKLTDGFMIFFVCFALFYAAVDCSKVSQTRTQVGRRRLGPSGKPKIHNPHYNSRKAAREGARRGGQGAPVKDRAHGAGQRDHYHSTNRDGSRRKDGVHHTFGGQKGGQ